MKQAGRPSTFSDEATARIESRKHQWPPELQERMNREWSEFYRDVEIALGEDSASETVRSLAPDVRGRGDWPTDQRRWLLRSEVQEFMSKAFETAAIRLRRA